MALIIVIVRICLWLRVQSKPRQDSLHKSFWGNTLVWGVCADRWINGSLFLVWWSLQRQLTDQGGFCDINCPPPVYSLAPFPISECERRLHLPVVSRVYFGGGRPETFFAYFMNSLLCCYSSSVAGLRHWKRPVCVCVYVHFVHFVFVRLWAMDVFPPARPEETCAICVNVPLCPAWILIVAAFHSSESRAFYLPTHLRGACSRWVVHACCACVSDCLHAVAADVSVNSRSAPPKQWKTDLEKKVVRIFHVYSLFPGRMETRKEGGGGGVASERAERPRTAWKPSFVQRRRKSEGNIFLTWMFLNLISKHSPPQRAVCVCLG